MALQLMHLEDQPLIIGQLGQRRRHLQKLLIPQDVLAG
jgi:hypothetical protein